MNYLLIPKELRPIAEKVEADQRISEADALALYGSNDLNALGMIANVVRERKNGNYASYIHNRYINYSNICVLSCQFCAFAPRNATPMPLNTRVTRLSGLSRKRFPWNYRVHMVVRLASDVEEGLVSGPLARLARLDPDLTSKHLRAIEVRLPRPADLSHADP
jgi:aminodeoxyfutalosine synthase